MSNRNQALFGDDEDDSSDEDEDLSSPQKASGDGAAAAASETTTAVETATEDADKKKKDGDDVGDATTTTTADQPEATKGVFAESDDDDDDEPEFDDKGAVVGLAADAASKPAPAPQAPPKRDSDRRSDDEDMGDNEDGGGMHDGNMDVDSPTVMKQLPPRIDNRPLTLPHIKRPNTNTNNGSDNNNVTLHITKLPNLIGIQTSAFEPENYHPSLEEEDFGPSAVHNLIRWRYKRDATGHLVRDEQDRLQRESNTRLVEWEDGSFTLHVGTEVFEVESKDHSAPDGFVGLNGHVHLSQPATGEDGKSAGTVLECFGTIASRLTARPSSLQSEAHKSLTVAVRQRTIKKARIAEIATAEDPEKLKAERIKLKTELEKASAAKKKKAGGGRYNSGAGGGRWGDDQNYDTIDLGDTKRRTRYGDGDDDDYYDEDRDRGPRYAREAQAEEEDEADDDLAQDTTFNTGRPLKRGRRDAVDDDDDSVVQQDDDDDEEEDAPRVKKGKKPARAVFDDDESE